jgi:pyridoxamine 5'-phosphate oxidase family protein
MTEQAPPADFYPPEQLRYLRSQQVGRLATVTAAGQPRVAPVGFRVDRDTGTIDIGGRRMRDTAKFRRVRRSGRAALVVDDVLPPWQPRGIEIAGRAEAFDTGFRSRSPVFDGAFIRLHPDRVHVWGDLTAQPSDS